MNKRRVLARWKTIALVSLLALLVVGCADIRRGVAWPALALVEVKGETHLLVAYENRVDLLNPENGRAVFLTDSSGDIIMNDSGDPERWQIEGAAFDNAQFFAPPLRFTEDGETMLLFPTYNNRMLSFVADTTLPVDDIPLADGVLDAVTVSDGLYYIPYRNGNVVALDRDSLDEVWSVETDEGVWASPLLHDGVLYIPSIDHFLYAVDAESGQAVWDAPVDLEGAIASTPLYHDGYLYVGSYSHKLYKISMAGDIVATYEGRNWIWSTPVVYEDVLYYTDLSGSAYALRLDDLSEIWATQAAERGIRPSPVVTDEFVVVASRDGRVYWLDRATGTEIHVREMEGRPEILSNMLLVEAIPEQGLEEAMIVVGSADAGRLVAAFALDNSLPVWVYGR